MLTSVILSVYNGEAYIIEAIESVLAQSVPLELIIINDGSSDNTAKLIEQYRISKKNQQKIYCLTQKNQGPAAAQNHGIRLAQGNYLAFIDADDIWEPNKLSLQTEILNEEPDIDMVFGYMQQFHSPELSYEQRQRLICPAKKQAALLAVGLCIRRTAFEKVGPFNPKWRKGHFIDWLARAQEMGLRYQVPEQLVFRRRLHMNNISNLNAKNNLDYVRLLKEKLDRQRG